MEFTQENGLRCLEALVVHPIQRCVVGVTLNNINMDTVNWFSTWYTDDHFWFIISETFLLIWDGMVWLLMDQLKLLSTKPATQAQSQKHSLWNCTLGRFINAGRMVLRCKHFTALRVRWSSQRPGRRFSRYLDSRYLDIFIPPDFCFPPSTSRQCPGNGYFLAAQHRIIFPRQVSVIWESFLLSLSIQWNVFNKLSI